MWTTAQIRRQLAKMADTKPFSIRKFLAFGARAAVDQAFARLVKTGEVVRVARGLYIKANSPSPSVVEVALAKAAAFNRTIVIHGSQAAVLLNIIEKPNRNHTTINEHVFATSGRSTSFRFGHQIIRFIGTADRKMQLGDSKLGLAIRSLWYLGVRTCSMGTASQAVQSFTRTERQEFRKRVELMPGWMHELFISIKRYWEHSQQSVPMQFAWNESPDPSLCPTLLKRQAFPHISQ